MEVDLLNRGAVNLRLGRSQRLEDANRSCLRSLADRSLANDLPNLVQPAAVLVWRGHSCPRRLFTRFVLSSVSLTLPVRVRVTM